MNPMYLPDVEARQASDAQGMVIEQMRHMGVPVPQILHLFAFKPDRTNHLAQFTQEVMRGPSPLSPGMRELIAALTSKVNNCPF